MSETELWTGELALLLAAGFGCGVLNTLAGGGSLIAVPLLVLLGLPGTIANGTNRIGVLVQNIVATWRFRAQGISEFRRAAPVIAPVVMGSVIGAAFISSVSDATFERLFGMIMLLLLVPTLRNFTARASTARPVKSWSPAALALTFFGIGLYGGSLQAGVGIPLLFALSRTGLDLVRSNATKVLVIAALTLTAAPVFIWRNQVAWLPAIALAAGYAVGGAVGASLAIRGGERLIRPVIGLAILGFAGRMFGLY